MWEWEWDFGGHGGWRRCGVGDFGQCWGRAEGYV